MALEVSHEAARKLVRKDLKELAPKFRKAVESAIAECNTKGYPVMVYEALRTHELASMYYKLGASKAKDGWKTWHFYGLAVDVIHPKKYWKAWDDLEWSKNVVAIFKKYELDWGGDWTSFMDKPHFQWGKCKASPSDVAIELYKTKGIHAVWEAVRAQ
jgi:peptidoglycan LD-endopeptidase CwlK